MDVIETKDQGLEILVEMAQRGEIDPWNIDLIDVTDKYLATLESRAKLDLRLPGRALFYAAVMLRLKSEALEEPVPEESFEDDWVEEDDLPRRPTFLVLDGLVRRRTSVKQPRTRPITLVELIDELKRLEKESRPAPGENALRRRPLPTVRQLAHEEDIEGDIRRLYLILGRHFEQTDTISLSTIALEGEDRPGVYLALIFLDSRGLIRLEQESFYGDITIRAEADDDETQANLAA